MSTHPRQVLVASYDHGWPQQFQQESQKLILALHEYHVQISHIGSTSVEGLAAKPIIDILIEFAPLPATEILLTAFGGLGYQIKDALDFDDYAYFKKGDRLRGFHLHVCQKNHPMAEVHKAFKTILNQHEDVRARYADVKMQLAAQYATQRSAYRAHKKKFISAVLRDYSEIGDEMIGRLDGAHKNN